MRRKTMKKSRGSRRMKGGAFGDSSTSGSLPVSSQGSVPQPGSSQGSVPGSVPAKPKSLSNLYGWIGGKRKNKTNKRKNRKH